MSDPQQLMRKGEDALAAGKGEQARSFFARAVEAAPDQAMPRALLSMTLSLLGKHGPAVDAGRAAAALGPDDPDMHATLGSALRASGAAAAAVVAFERACALAPGRGAPRAALANALHEAGRSLDAVRAARAGIEAEPDSPDCYGVLGAVLFEIGRAGESIGVTRAALERWPDDERVLSSLASALNYEHEARPEGADAAAHARASLEAHLDLTQVMLEDVQPLPWAPVRDPRPDRPLRVCLLSPDLRTHSVAYFVLPLLEHADRSRVEFHCYALSALEDALTARLKRAAAGWRRLAGVGPRMIAEQARRDGVDVLIDLAGLTDGTGLEVLAHEPCPVQATYCGYPNTTGLGGGGLGGGGLGGGGLGGGGVDAGGTPAEWANDDAPTVWRIVDALTDPRDGPVPADEFHSERLLRLDGCFLCYAGPVAARDGVGPPPRRERAGGGAEASGPVFGSFNLMAKISERTLELWAGVLRATPGSRLLLKNAALESEQVRDDVTSRLASRGIDASRVECVGRTASIDDHLDVYARVDVALDTFPYHGTTTTCEALWMGVPVVTRVGDVHASRVGLSLLTALGRPAWACADDEAFIRTAAALASDQPALDALRRDLRPMLRASPLCDGPGFASRFEAGLREIWRATLPAR